MPPTDPDRPTSAADRPPPGPAPMRDWVRFMMEEIRRKEAEEEAARDEQRRRDAEAADGRAATASPAATGEDQAPRRDA